MPHAYACAYAYAYAYAYAHGHAHGFAGMLVCPALGPMPMFTPMLVPQQIISKLIFQGAETFCEKDAVLLLAIRILPLPCRTGALLSWTLNAVHACARLR